MSGLMHKVKDALQGGHKDGVFTLTQISPRLITLADLLTQKTPSSHMRGSKESTEANLAFMTLPSKGPLLTVTPFRLQTPASSAPLSMVSTVTVILAHLALASLIKGSLDRLEPKVSPALSLTAAPSLLPTPVSFIPQSLASTARETQELAVPASRTQS